MHGEHSYINHTLLSSTVHVSFNRSNLIMPVMVNPDTKLAAREATWTPNTITGYLKIIKNQDSIYFCILYKNIDTSWIFLGNVSG